MTRPRFLPDNSTLPLVATVSLASLLPASGQTAVAFGWVTNLAIALLFFLHGAKLSRQAIVVRLAAASTLGAGRAHCVLRPRLRGEALQHGSRAPHAHARGDGEREGVSRGAAAKEPGALL